MTGRRQAARPAGDPSLPIYLSLFLLLAAFFLLLNSLSPRQAARVETAVASVSGAFGGSGKPRPALRQDGPAMRWAEATGDALAELLPIGTLTAAPHERGARFALTTDSLFAGGDVALRGDRVPLIDRLVDRLGHPPTGATAALEVRLDARDTLAGQRAEALARALIGRGLDPSAMAVGVAHGGTHTVELLLAARPEPRR
jgi:hypothetical protein